MFYTQLFSNFQPKTASAVNPVRHLTGIRGWAGIFLACLLVIGNISAKASDLPDVQTKNPPRLDQTIAAIDGSPVSLADYKGTPVLVNFWAIWCPPCVAELPALDRAATELNSKSVKVLLVSVDRGGPDKAVPFLEERGVRVPDLAFDPKGALLQRFGARGLPTTILLSADQTQSWTFVGPHEWDKATVIAQIESFLGR